MRPFEVSPSINSLRRQLRPPDYGQLMRAVSRSREVRNSVAAGRECWTIIKVRVSRNLLQLGAGNIERPKIERARSIRDENDLVAMGRNRGALIDPVSVCQTISFSRLDAYPEKIGAWTVGTELICRFP